MSLLGSLFVVSDRARLRRSRRRPHVVRRALALLLPSLLVAQMLPQLAPVALAADQVSVTLNDAVTGTGYAGFNGDATNPNPQDLTALGATDWRIWGTGISETPLTGNARKNGGSGISSLGDIQLDPAINAAGARPARSGCRYGS